MGVSGPWRWTLSHPEGRKGSHNVLGSRTVPSGTCSGYAVGRVQVCGSALSTAALSVSTAMFAQMARVTKNREHTAVPR